MTTQNGHDERRISRGFEQSSMVTPFADLTTVDRTTLIDISSDVPLSEQQDIWTEGVERIASESEIRLRANNSSESLETVRYVPYVPGYKAETGIAIRIPEQPTGEQEIRWGYWDGTNGIYWGYDVDGVYVEQMRGGERQGKTYEDEWNGISLDAKKTLAEGVVSRLGLSLYNHGEVTHELFPRSDKNRQVRRVVHASAPRNQTTLSRQNLPLRVEMDNPDSGDLDVFVADRQAALRGDFTASKRVKSEFRTDISLSGTTWVPLISFRRKGSFEGINIETFSLSVQSENDIILQLRSDADLTGADFGSPSLVNADETAIEADTSATDVVPTSGFHRWLGSAPGGGGPDPTGFAELGDVDLRLKRDRSMTLMARRISGSDGNIPLAILSMEEQW